MSVTEEPAPAEDHVHGAAPSAPPRRLGDRVRQAGGHAQLKHSSKPGRVTVATHANRVIDVKTLASALRQAGLTVDQLRNLL